VDPRNSPGTLLAHPDREAASALPALEDLFRSAARQVRTRLVNRAGADIPVRLGVARITTVGEILDDTETRDGAAFALFRANPSGLPGMIIVQGQLLARVVGILLGEPLNSEQAPYRPRAVTGLELRIARRICEDVMQGLMLAWPEDQEAEFRMVRLGGSMRAVTGLAGTMPVVAASLDFGQPDDPYGLLSVCLPAQAARELKVVREDAVEREVEAMNVSRVMPLNLDVVAEIARLRISLSELRGLEVGSVLDLGPPREVQVRANERIIMTGEPGSSRGVRAVRINQKRDLPGERPARKKH
jgi:flagellar motor switch protein FliM